MKNLSVSQVGTNNIRELSVCANNLLVVGHSIRLSGRFASSRGNSFWRRRRHGHVLGTRVYGFAN